MWRNAAVVGEYIYSVEQNSLWKTVCLSYKRSSCPQIGKDWIEQGELEFFVLEATVRGRVSLELEIGHGKQSMEKLKLISWVKIVFLYVKTFT